jgi:hypothetical protein
VLERGLGLVFEAVGGLVVIDRLMMIRGRDVPGGFGVFPRFVSRVRGQRNHGGGRAPVAVCKEAGECSNLLVGWLA